MEQRDEPGDVALAVVEQLEGVRVVEVRSLPLGVGIARQRVEGKPADATAARSAMVSKTYPCHSSSDAPCFTLKMPLARV